MLEQLLLLTSNPTQSTEQEIQFQFCFYSIEILLVVHCNLQSNKRLVIRLLLDCLACVWFGPIAHMQQHRLLNAQY